MAYQETRFIAGNEYLEKLRMLASRPHCKENAIKNILKRIFTNMQDNRIELLQAKNGAIDFIWQNKKNTPKMYQIIFYGTVFITISDNRCSDMADALAAIA